ncbi:MAG: porphobilinogen synthase [Lentisphaeria bacterium]
MTTFPITRLRRLRSSPAIRDMLALPMPGPERFIYPVFVTAGRGVKAEIPTMPGQHRWSVDRLGEVAAAVAGQGVRTLLLFGVPPPAAKSPDAAAAADPEGLVPQALRTLRADFPDLQLFTDVCICAYTSDGHCELPAATPAARNDRALDALARMALCHAAAGAAGVAPSAMMDGQVQAIRTALDAAGFADRLLMSYSTKFASAMYGPFRDAAGSAPGHGDRSGYQADYRDLRTALREAAADAAEGADILMVKPALFYLDVICELRKNTALPLAAYNVSGEYAMLHAAAEKGYGDLRAMVREAIFALARAGTDIFISYWALRYRELLQP